MQDNPSSGEGGYIEAATGWRQGNPPDSGAFASPPALRHCAASGVLPTGANPPPAFTPHRTLDTPMPVPAPPVPPLAGLPLAGLPLAGLPAGLPIVELLPALLTTLDHHPTAVLEAPPGAGKTTGVPLALLHGSSWRKDGRILVVEPRRLATRAAARRMAFLLEEPVGERVGYRVRGESQVGPRTRIEVITDGLFLRRIQGDPGLDGVAAVLFDEFHERGLETDLGLALCREAQMALREDLRLLVMSATLDTGPVAALLDNAPCLRSEGRAYPVTVAYRDALPLPPASPGPGGSRPEDALVQTMTQAIRLALRQEPEGDILAFLPGSAAIRRTENRLRESTAGGSGTDDERLRICPLHGDLSSSAQEIALAPAPPGCRKVILASAIAETSLTLDGVRIVIDSGLARVARFDPRTGMTRLVTVRASQATTEQRRGRAGRLGPGVCWRLWPQAEQRALPPFPTPAIREADLAPLRLELALWGAGDPASLIWLDPPPPPALAQAQALLQRLGAVDAAGAITPHGRTMAGLGAHPRLAHMMVTAVAHGAGPEAAALAALLEERDILRPGGLSHERDSDLTRRLELVLAPHDPTASLAADPTLDRAALQRVRQNARRWRQSLPPPPATLRAPALTCGDLVALAYPDRIARRRPGSAPQYRLSNGRGAAFADPSEPLAGAPWLAVADLDGTARESRIFRAAPLTQASLELVFADSITTHDAVVWNPQEDAVLARRQFRLDQLVIRDEALPAADPAAMAAALIGGIRGLGLGCLPWEPALEHWRSRVAFVRRLDGDAGPAGPWPDLGDDALLASLETWLAPWLDGMSRRSHLKRLDLAAALGGLLSWPQRQALDRLAPVAIPVPTGSRLSLDYSGDVPVLAVRVQEMFGCATTPTVGDGRVPVLLHLLSPARRPIQVTRDLAGFWAGSWKTVRKELAGQYPKHPWPEDPLAAAPTRHTKRRQAADVNRPTP